MEKKYLEKYIEAVGGEENAMRHLAKLAKKSERAREMLKLLTEMTSSRKQQQKEVKHKFVPSSPVVQRKRVFHPKEKFLEVCNKLGVSPDDVETDDSYNTFVVARWIRGKAFVNDKRVVIPKRFLQEKNELFKDGMHIKFKVLGVKEDKVIAEPVETVKGRKFVAQVVLSNYNMQVRPMDVSKKVIVPRKYLSTLLVSPGSWEMQALQENDFGIIAQPVKPLKQEDVEENIGDQRLQQLRSEGKITL